MSYRIGLGLLQGIGALSILPYPFILIVNVMSIAAKGQTARGALPYVLLSLYPVVWIALDALSWRALGRGSLGGAFVLASLPVAASLAGIASWAVESRADQQREQARLQTLRAKIEQANLLSWSVMCFYWNRYTGTTPLSLDALLKAIAARGTSMIPHPSTALLSESRFGI